MYSLYPNLEAAMAARGTSIECLGKVIGNSEEIVYQKMHGLVDWTLMEAVEICRYFKHPDIKLLFLRKLR